MGQCNEFNEYIKQNEYYIYQNSENSKTSINLKKVINMFFIKS